MKLHDLGLKGPKIIELDLFRDTRGFFVERFNGQKLKELGLDFPIAQINHSHSLPGVIRGMHLQVDPPQRKLVAVSRGRVFDVIVDLRKDSPSYGQHLGEELSSENGRMLYVPAGFAHGFCVLGDEPVDLVYFVDTNYNPKGEVGVLYSDPSLGIRWPVMHPVVSERDRLLPLLKDSESR